MEQLCAEYDTIDEFLLNLEDRVLKESASQPSLGDVPILDMPSLVRKISSASAGGGGKEPIARSPMSRGLSHLGTGNSW